MNFPIKRCTYNELKFQALEVCYDFCRDEMRERNPSHLQVLARVNDRFEGVFNYSLEELMFCVIELVLSGGWHEGAEKKCYEWIDRWKLKNDFMGVIKEVSIEEMELFMHDATALKIFEG